MERQKQERPQIYKQHRHVSPLHLFELCLEEPVHSSQGTWQPGPAQQCPSGADGLSTCPNKLLMPRLSAASALNAGDTPHQSFPASC